MWVHQYFFNGAKFLFDEIITQHVVIEFTSRELLDHFFLGFLDFVLVYLLHIWFVAFLVHQINLRGLDGIQGPVYVGTGCVFNRTALYGYEPPHKPKKKKAGALSSCFGGSRKKTSKSSKKGDKKKSSKHVDPTVPIFNLEDIEEGVEGMLLMTLMSQIIIKCGDQPFHSLFYLE